MQPQFVSPFLPGHGQMARAFLMQLLLVSLHVQGCLAAERLAEDGRVRPAIGSERPLTLVLLVGQQMQSEVELRTDCLLRVCWRR